MERLRHCNIITVRYNTIRLKRNLGSNIKSKVILLHYSV